MTISHLRFGPRPIRSTYLISQANVCSLSSFPILRTLERIGMRGARRHALVECSIPADQLWTHLPKTIQEAIIDKNIRVFTIDADSVARNVGLRGRISIDHANMLFQIKPSHALEAAIESVKKAIDKSFGKRGQTIVDKNYAAVEQALSQLHEVQVPSKVDAAFDLIAPVPAAAPDFVQRITAAIISCHGDQLPVSALPPDGTWPSGTTQWEKRNIARNIPRVG